MDEMKEIGFSRQQMILQARESCLKKLYKPEIHNGSKVHNEPEVYKEKRIEEKQKRVYNSLPEPVRKKDGIKWNFLFVRWVLAVLFFLFVFCVKEERLVLLENLSYDEIRICLSDNQFLEQAEAEVENCIANNYGRYLSPEE